MTEREEVRRLIDALYKGVDDIQPHILKSQGRLEFAREQGHDVTINEIGLVSLQTSIAVRMAIADVLAHISNWIDAVEAESNENRRFLLKLLGLTPDSTKDEVVQAVDEIGEMIGDARRRRGGGM